jgi:DNA end-binding protein Ku
MPRPYWSGQVQISLVSFAVNFFVATESKSEIRFHQIHRDTGERVRHQKVSANDEAPIEKGDIVKGYEYQKGEYITIEPSEIEHLRVPSKHSIDISQCVAIDEIDPAYFEKPYFVTPDGDNQAEAFAVIRKALADTNKAALGKIAFGGREHLVAIMAPEDDKLPGMMAYTMRYAEELRNPAEYFRDIKPSKIEEDQLELAQELIKRKTAKFNPEKFKDEYEAALRELVDAKINKQPIPRDEPAPRNGKVINLMDALRSSLKAKADSENIADSHKTTKQAKATTNAKRTGPTLLKKPAGRVTNSKRKSA